MSFNYQVNSNAPAESLEAKQPAVDNGRIKAFYNVCPHRGNRIAQNEFGSVAQFTCSFHGWQFHCNGRLKGITDEETFAPRLIAHRPGLTELRCDSLGGLIFVNMDGKA